MKVRLHDCAHRKISKVYPCIYQVQLIPFYGDIQLSLYMGIFLKIDTLQPMEKVQISPFLCKRAQNRKELHDVN